MKKTVTSGAPRQQGRLKIIPWDVIQANQAAAARAIDLTCDENDDIFSLNEAEQQELPKLVLPESLSQKLFDHQRYGVNWMYNLFSNNEKGAILADDMGLGKTLQVTSFLTGTMMEEKIFTSLVLTPKSVIPGWERELNNNLKMHLTNVNITVIDAGMKKKQRSNLLSEIEESRGRAKYIIIMSHHLLLTMIEEVGRINWDCVVLDEGHIIKNTTTKMSQTMHQLKSPFRLLLSGTPIQNDLKEFWALVNWATQGSRFGREVDFRKTFADPILRGQDPSAGEKTRSLAAEARISLVRATRPILLRRKKADQRQKELQLPEKKELVVWIRLSSKQRQQYYEYVHSTRFEEAMRQSTYPVEVINTLKTICRHPILLKDAQQAREIDELDSALQRMGLEDGGTADGPQEATSNYAKGHFFDILGRTPTKDELLAESTKLRVLARMTSRLVKAEHRVLIFSQSKRMLEIIQFMFVEYGYPTYKIDGSTPSEERQYIIDEFNTPGDDYSGPRICLLTTKACGVGINLIGADRVIIFDPSWNPAEDSQAVDRAYRIGQTKPVIVYRLIHSSCVEEKVYQKQVFKEGLRVISEKGNETKRYFSEKSQLRELLALGGKDAVEILKQVPNKMDLLQLDNLFGMDSVIGCTRHDRLYKEDQPDASTIKNQDESVTIEEHKTINISVAHDKAINEEDAEFDGNSNDKKKVLSSIEVNNAVSKETCIDLTQDDDDDAEEIVQVVKKYIRKKKIFIEEDEEQEEIASLPVNVPDTAFSENVFVGQEIEVKYEDLTDAFFNMSLANDDTIDLKEIADIEDVNIFEQISENENIENTENIPECDLPNEEITGELISEPNDSESNDITADENGRTDFEDPENQDTKVCNDELPLNEKEIEHGNDNTVENDKDNNSIDSPEVMEHFVECFQENKSIIVNENREESVSSDNHLMDANLVSSSISEENEAGCTEELRENSKECEDTEVIEDQLNMQEKAQDVSGQELDVSSDETVEYEENDHQENIHVNSSFNIEKDVFKPMELIKDPYDDDYSDGNGSDDDNDCDEEFNLIFSNSVSSHQYHRSSSCETIENYKQNTNDFIKNANQFVSLVSMKELRELQRQTSNSNQSKNHIHTIQLSQQSQENEYDNNIIHDITAISDKADEKEDIILSSQTSYVSHSKPSTILHQYCNVSLFSPSISSESSVVLDMLPLDQLSNCGDSRRSSSACNNVVPSISPVAVNEKQTENKSTISDTITLDTTTTKTSTHKHLFRNSLCDKKRQLLYQQLAHPSTANLDTTTKDERERIPLTPIRNSENNTSIIRAFPTSGYLSRIKVMGCSVKKEALDITNIRPNFSTQRPVTATPKVQLGFVDYSFMDDSSCDENSGVFSPHFNKPQMDTKSMASSLTRDRAQSMDTSIELASELARIVEATHDHAEEEEQRRYEEEYAETTSSVNDILDQLASFNVQDLVQRKNKLSLFDVEEKKQKTVKLEKVLCFDSC